MLRSSWSLRSRECFDTPGISRRRRRPKATTLAVRLPRKGQHGTTLALTLWITLVLRKTETEGAPVNGMIMNGAGHREPAVGLGLGAGVEGVGLRKGCQFVLRNAHAHLTEVLEWSHYYLAWGTESLQYCGLSVNDVCLVYD